MINPYHALPDSAYWRRSVGAVPGHAVDPVTTVPFMIAPSDRVATAGSCFAQHIARELTSHGFDLMIEEGDPSDPADAPAWRAFSAAFGNIYTARQLMQLFDRAYGTFTPQDSAWRRADGRWIDPFRPLICGAGFATAEAVEHARRGHFEAVRRMFDTCDVLIFTLGLTETWRSTVDGAVFPIAPRVEGEGDGAYGFHNAGVDEIVGDMRRFLRLLRTVNPAVRVILTVSPVPLIATYAPRHVLVSTIASKSILRAAADTICAGSGDIAYFPSYEIITGPQARGGYFGADLRSIEPEGVAQVMAVFARHFLGGEGAARRADMPGPSVAEVGAALETMQQAGAVICDEEVLDRIRRP